jgi:mono/diheme cytochrome c family protein
MNVRLCAVLLGALLSSGCNRVTHDMADQPRKNPAQTSPLFSDGNASRPPPSGSVVFASGDAAAVSSGRDTRRADRIDAAAHVPPLQHGRERYTIYCAPCHGASGRGDGEVVRRGFPAPPPLQALQGLKGSDGDARLDALIAHGIGTMPGFADRVSGADRRAIVADLHTLGGEATK